MKVFHFGLLAAVLILASCQSAPPIPADASADIYFQRAQSDSDSGQYEDALKVYNDFLASHPDATNDNVYPARYEIALLYYKLNQLAESKARFEDILGDYGNLEKSSGAPSWVKMLSQKKLQQIKDLLAKANPTPTPQP